MTTVVLCYPVQPDQLDQIQRAAPAYRIISSDQDRIAKDIFTADIYCGHARRGLPWDEIVRHGRLSWIQSSAAGLDHCLHPAVVNSEIVVSGSSGLFAPQVAEQTLAILLALLRRIPLFHSAQQQHHYARQPTDDLRGKTVGILGLGLNGQQIARVLKPFDVKLLGCDYFPEAATQVDFPVLPPAESVELFRRSNILISALPLTAETQNLIGAAHFAACPAGSYFVNVGRGQTVDETAMGRALASGQLAAAGVDVVAVEPLPAQSEIWDWPNFLITPHVGAQSSSRYQAVSDFFVENLRRWQTGGTLLNLVDKTLGFPRPEHRLRLPRTVG